MIRQSLSIKVTLAVVKTFDDDSETRQRTLWDSFYRLTLTRFQTLGKKNFFTESLNLFGGGRRPRRCRCPCFEDIHWSQFLLLLILNILSFFKNGQSPASFSLISSFQTKITIINITKIFEKISIYYMVKGF